MEIKKQATISKLILFALLATGLPVSWGNADTPSTKLRNVYSDIANHYLPVFNITQKQVDLTLDESGDEITKEDPDFAIKPLSPGEQRRIAFAILSNHGDKSYRHNTKVFDEDFWRDLELFSGPVRNRKAHLAQAWNRTITAMGDIVSKRLLVRPIIDTEILENRQKAIKILQTDRKLASGLKKSLTYFAQQEPVLYSYWEAETAANKKVINDLYFGGKIFPESFNTNPAALETLTRLRNFGTANIVLYPLTLALSFCTLFNYSVLNTTLLTAMRQAPGTLWHGIQFGYEYFWQLPQSAQTAAIFQLIAAGSLYGYTAYKALSQEAQRVYLEKYLQTKLIAVSGAIRGMRLMYNNAVKNKALRKAIPSLKHIDKLAHASQELSEFLKIIITKTFTGKASFLSLTGRVLAANKLLGEVKNHLVKSFEAVGELDAYLAMADLLNKFKGKKARFSYVDFIKDTKQPHMDVKGFWLPQLLHDKNIQSGKHAIVVNSLKMSTEPGGTRNIILTGPNTAGKSTIIKALIASLLLAQSYGIAPAQQMNFTPFSKIQTYINIPDSASEGISLYKAEILRVAHLLKNIRNVGRGKFAFTILDEIFNGTSPEEAIVGSANFMETLTQMPHSMNIIATHYGLLTRIEEYTGGIFKNYKVTVNIHPDDSMTFPFTIMPGRSDQHIALALIKQEGLLNENGRFNLAKRLAEDIAIDGIK